MGPQGLPPQPVSKNKVPARSEFGGIPPEPISKDDSDIFEYQGIPKKTGKIPT